MRIALTLAAPFALALAACEVEPNEPDDRIVETGETDPNAVDVEVPDVPVETPTVTTTPTPEQGAQQTPAQ